MSAPNLGCSPGGSRRGPVRWGLLLLLLGSGCTGPEAPDGALCQDLVHRLCAAPICPAVSGLDAGPGGDCELQALARSGCDQSGFAFTTPSRERFLECRAIVVHSGVSAESHPVCGEVQSLATECPNVIDLLEGGTP